MTLPTVERQLYNWVCQYGLKGEMSLDNSYIVHFNNPRIFGAAISYDLTNHQLHYSTDHRMSENALVFNLNNYFVCEETIPDCVFDSLINNIKLAKEFKSKLKLNEIEKDFKNG